MFVCRQERRGARSTVEVAFTDRAGGVSAGPYASLDLTSARPGSDAELRTNRAVLAAAFGVERLAMMKQVHGADVVVDPDPDGPSPTCDAMVTTATDVALCVRAADCVPVVLADVEAAVVAVAHAGRRGVAAGVVPATVAAMRAAGARRIEAWIGPSVCGGCYEVPAALRATVCVAEPAAFSCTTWGAPALDLGAAVVAQLERSGCGPVNPSSRCTRESEDLFSYRRQGTASGRQAGLVVLRRVAAPAS